MADIITGFYFERGLFNYIVKNENFLNKLTDTTGAARLRYNNLKQTSGLHDFISLT